MLKENLNKRAFKINSTTKLHIYQNRTEQNRTEQNMVYYHNLYTYRNNVKVNKLKYNLTLNRRIFKWNNSSFIFGTVHYHFRGIKVRFEVSQPIVKSQVRLHGSACWPGSILVATANHIRLWQNKG